AGAAAVRGDRLRGLRSAATTIESAGCERSGPPAAADRAADRWNAAEPAAAATRRHAWRARFGSARLRTARLRTARLGPIWPRSIGPRPSGPDIRDAIWYAAIPIRVRRPVALGTTTATTDTAGRR